MDLDELLRCLAEAESGELREELTGGRYVVVQYNPEGTYFDDADLAELFGAPAPGTGVTDEDGEEFEDEEDAYFDVIGVVPSVYEALDLLGEELPDEEWLTELDEEEWAAEAAEFGEDVFGTAAENAGRTDGSDGEEGNEWLDLLRGIRDPRRRSVVQLLCGVLGPMDFLTEEFAKDVYLGGVATRLPGARFVMLASAAPPHQEVAFGILELPPRSTPDPVGRALLRACAAGDVGALSAALGEGADVGTLDEYGATPLHHAVAARSAAAVDALLAAGADPRAQSAFGSAPQFTAAGPGRPHPTTRRVEGEEHWSVLWPLLDAGADVNAVNTAGQTLLDLAIRADPYPERQVRLLRERGAVSGELTNISVDWLVRRVPYGYEDQLRILLNHVRFLLDTGAPYDHPLDSLLASAGYYERELSADYLVELIDIMVSRGVRDRPGTYGRTARESAQHWVDHGLTHYQAVVDRLTEAADESPSIPV
ncbi:MULTISPECIES: ankyrin repeat domain-containing protein [Streptomyces]|uniref:ankyrin repeat domain-containing protein n=1 Tax=Streptomyces lycopersici TaxID=2974589 RepID=UPI0021CEE601|nr:ankyrin repeat domain-containing protein [Streptomyces sp. NEAU-383]